MRPRAEAEGETDSYKESGSGARSVLHSCSRHASTGRVRLRSTRCGIGDRFPSIAQVPEWTREADVFQQCLGFLESMTPPIRLQLVLVPAVGKLPPLLRSQEGSALKVSSQAPTIDVLFRPEEKHGGSGESNVVPPVMRGDGEVNHALAAYEPSIPHFQTHRIAAVAAGSRDHRIFSEGRRNAQRIPDADSPVSPPVRLNTEA